MPTTNTIGLIGFGRIGRTIYERIRAEPAYELAYAFVRTPNDELPRSKQLTDPAQIAENPVDLCVEVAGPDAVAEVGPTVLQESNLALLSGGALADPAVKDRLTSAATTNRTSIILPHGALLGIDGLVDARDALTDVSIETTKHPEDIDFEFTPEFSAGDITESTTVYDGPVRALCRSLPHSFNSHAVVALASMGLDDTRSRLVADPDADRSKHVIRASGEQFSFSIERESVIGAAKGNFTHVTVLGSIRRLLTTDGPLVFV